jgi:hypothetical protein
MKFICYDINPATTEEEIADYLAPIAPVTSVTIIREGNEQKPAAIIEMDVSASMATQLAERFNQRISPRGNRVRVHVLPTTA